MLSEGEVGGAESFSVYYGQSHAKGSDNPGTYELDGPHITQNVTEFIDELTLDMTAAEMAEAMEARKFHIGLRSGTSVHSVINVVLVLDSFLPQTKVHKIRRRRR